jgi:membrane protein DedA with SNARE-associated domain
MLSQLLGLHGVVVFLVVAALVFAEDALFVGFVLPGETAAVLGGVAASVGHVSLPVMVLVVIAAAIVGDSVGYEVGKRLGPRLLRSRLLRRRAQRLDQARQFLARRGGAAVFLGRFTAFFRAVMPALAGVAEMPYRRFLVFNAAGGIVWGTGAVVLGYLAGSSYAVIEKTAGRAASVVALLLVGALLAGWSVRSAARRREEGRKVTSPQER